MNASGNQPKTLFSVHAQQESNTTISCLLKLPAGAGDLYNDSPAVNKHAGRLGKPASSVCLVLNDKTAANSSIAALVTQMQASIQEHQTRCWDSIDDCEAMLSNLTIHGELGQGGYSFVYYGTWNGNQVAIKVLQLTHAHCIWFKAKITVVLVVKPMFDRMKVAKKSAHLSYGTWNGNQVAVKALHLTHAHCVSFQAYITTFVVITMCDRIKVAIKAIRS